MGSRETAGAYNAYGIGGGKGRVQRACLFRKCWSVSSSWLTAAKELGQVPIVLPSGLSAYGSSIGH